MTIRFEVPDALQDRRAEIESTIRPVIALAFHEEATAPWDSKVGGVPYRPLDMQWPADSAGRPLHFLAQINFAQLPHLPRFPDAGILQFFVGEDLGWLGCHFSVEDAPVYDTYRVVFHERPYEDPALLRVDVPPYENPEDGPFIRPVELRMTGTLVELPISPDDRNFRAALNWTATTPDRYVLGEQLHGVYQEACAAVHPTLDQIGGYPAFRQSDPRNAGQSHRLLFQLASNEDLGFVFGDVGIMNFFIQPDDLRKGDFTRVVYYWDCY